MKYYLLGVFTHDLPLNKFVYFLQIRLDDVYCVLLLWYLSKENFSDELSCDTTPGILRVILSPLFNFIYLTCQSEYKQN